MPSKLCQMWATGRYRCECVCVCVCEMYQSFAVGSHPGGCRHPAQGGCRWTNQSVVAGPESCAVFFYWTKNNNTELKGVTSKITEPCETLVTQRTCEGLRAQWLTSRLSKICMIDASCQSPGTAADLRRHLFPRCRQNRVAFVGKVKPGWPRTKCMFLTSGCTHTHTHTHTRTNTRTHTSLHKVRGPMRPREERQRK